MRRLLLIALLLGTLADPAGAAECPRAGAVAVPGAERQELACLDDLTTAGTVASGHTDPTDWAGLTPRAQRNPSGVPGLQVDGYFPDTSTFNTTHGWFHDAQFVVRLPDEWNGKLLVTGAPGVRKQYAPDPVIGDWAVARGYAYASTDKGNSGVLFYRDGAAPGDAVAEWHARVTELTRATRTVVQQRYGRAPDRTYVTGISNGGYLTRWQLEHHPELYDGGVDWEGTLFTPDGPNLFTYLPAILRAYPGYRASGDPAALYAAGLPRGSEFLWDDHYAEYWDLTQRTYREEFDPDYDGALPAGVPFCPPGAPFCDADYDLAARPPAVREALGRVSLTGAIGKPLLTLHGTLDALLPIGLDSDVYAGMVDGAGRGALHRYYRIENGNHVDGRYDRFPDRVRPIWPCWTQALGALEGWVERGAAPPPDQLVPDPGQGDVANECALAPAPPDPDAPDAPDRSSPGGASGRPGGANGRRRARLRLRVTPRRDRRPPYRFRIRGRLRPAGTAACPRRRAVVRVRAAERLRPRTAVRVRAAGRLRPRTAVRVRPAGRLRPRTAVADPLRRTPVRVRAAGRRGPSTRGPAVTTRRARLRGGCRFAVRVRVRGTGRVGVRARVPGTPARARARVRAG